MLLSVQRDHFTADTYQQPLMQYRQYYYVVICTARPLYSLYLSTMHTARYAILFYCTLYSHIARLPASFIADFSEIVTF
jgi:hypothetical protein